MGVNESAKYQLAKTFTELAIQNDLIDKRATATATAEEVSRRYGNYNDGAVGKRGRYAYRYRN